MAALRLTVAVWLQGANGHCAINDIPMHMVHRCPPPSYILHFVNCILSTASRGLHLVDCISSTALCPAAASLHVGLQYENGLA